MIYALFIAGPICRDLRAFGGTNQAKKFAVGGPQLILRAGCLELVYLLASGQYMVQCRTGRRRHRNHRWDMEKPHGRITARRMGAGSSFFSTQWTMTTPKLEVTTARRMRTVQPEEAPSSHPFFSAFVRLIFG